LAVPTRIGPELGLSVRPGRRGVKERLGRCGLCTDLGRVDIGVRAGAAGQLGQHHRRVGILGHARE
jgi:hypothetical protein